MNLTPTPTLPVVVEKNQKESKNGAKRMKWEIKKMKKWKSFVGKYFTHQTLVGESKSNSSSTFGFSQMASFVTITQDSSVLPGRETWKERRERE